MRKVLRKFNLVDDTSSINKYLRNQYKLLKLKDATVEEYTNNLLYIINNIGENNMNDIQTPIMFHEQFLFAAEIYNHVKLALRIKNELDNVDEHLLLGYVPPPDDNGDYPGDNVGGQLINAHTHQLENNQKVLCKFIDKLAD